MGQIRPLLFSPEIRLEIRYSKNPSVPNIQMSEIELWKGKLRRLYRMVPYESRVQFQKQL
jgi:hypothetical protein